MFHSLITPAVQEQGEAAVSDEELVARSLSGQETAFRHLYDKYRKPVFGTIYRIITDYEEAQDLTQETFFAAYRSLKTWSPLRARFSSWIYKIAMNQAIDHWRRRKRRVELSLTEIMDELGPDLPLCRGGEAKMEDILHKKQRLAEIRDVLESLPQTQSRFAVLRYFEGLKLREIAEIEGFKIGTVKSVLHRATEALRLELSNQESAL